MLHVPRDVGRCSQQRAGINVATLCQIHISIVHNTFRKSVLQICIVN